MRASAESLWTDVLNVLGNGKRLESAAEEATFSYGGQLRVLFEHDLAEPPAVTERSCSEFRNTAGNDQRSYFGILEQFRFNRCKPIWEAEHLCVVLADAKLLWCHPHVWRNVYLLYPRVPQAEPAKLSDVLVHPEFFQCGTACECQTPDPLQMRRRDECIWHLGTQLRTRANSDRPQVLAVEERAGLDDR